MIISCLKAITVAGGVNFSMRATWHCPRSASCPNSQRLRRINCCGLRTIRAPLAGKGVGGSVKLRLARCKFQHCVCCRWPARIGKNSFLITGRPAAESGVELQTLPGAATAQNRQRNFPAHPHGPERARKKRCKSFAGGTMFNSNTPLVATRSVNAVQLTRFVEVSMT